MKTRDKDLELLRQVRALDKIAEKDRKKREQATIRTEKGEFKTLTGAMIAG